MQSKAWASWDVGPGTALPGCAQVASCFASLVPWTKGRCQYSMASMATLAGSVINNAKVCFVFIQLRTDSNMSPLFHLER